MKLWITTVWLIIVSLVCTGQQTADLGRQLDAPTPKAARVLLKRGVDLAGRDRIDDAITTLKKAIALAPNFVDAHREYIRLRINFQGRMDEVAAEYEALMAREPDNPVYPLVLAMEPRWGKKMARYKRVAELAPEWSWGHYANAYVIPGRPFFMLVEKYEGKGEQILAEVLNAIEKDGSVDEFYWWAIKLQEDLGRIDDAILTAEKMGARNDLRPEGLRQLWRLRLIKAGGTETARASLKAELAALFGKTRDIKLLAAIYQAYVNLLKDSPGSGKVEQRIRRLDPAWYPERGRSNFMV